MTRRSTVTGLIATLGCMVSVPACSGEDTETPRRDTGVARQGSSFGGSWSGTGDQIFFDLELVHDGSELTGHHCGTTGDATRTDCAMDVEDHSSIMGSVVGDVAEVRFVSAYSGASGAAVITLHGDSLTWQITERPDDEFYLPSRATLHRVAQSEESDEQS